MINDVTQMPIEETALYKLAHTLYTELEAVRSHQHNPELQSKLEEVVKHLVLGYVTVSDTIVVSYQLDKAKLDARS